MTTITTDILRNVPNIGTNHENLDKWSSAGADNPPPPQGFDPLPTQRVPPLVLFKKSIFANTY